MLDHANGKPQGSVDGPHPFRVPFSQIIVHRDHVHVPRCQGVQRGRQRGYKRLAFAGGHLGYLPLVQHYPAYKLHVKMPKAYGPLRGFPDNRENMRQGFLHGLVLNAHQLFLVLVAVLLGRRRGGPFAQFLYFRLNRLKSLPQRQPELPGLCPKQVVGKRGAFPLKGIYLINYRLQFPNGPLVLRAEYAFEKVYYKTDHILTPSLAHRFARSRFSVKVTMPVSSVGYGYVTELRNRYGPRYRYRSTSPAPRTPLTTPPSPSPSNTPS